MEGFAVGMIEGAVIGLSTGALLGWLLCEAAVWRSIKKVSKL
jgi:hypothetical protein